MPQTLPGSDVPLTAKGTATRSRIVAAAAQLMLTGGVARTTLDEVGAAAMVGKSQMYHYFRDKAALVEAVIRYQTGEVMAGQEPYLSALDTWEAWTAWRDGIVEHQRSIGFVGGCPLGSLAGELSDTDEAARRLLVASFERWEAHFRAGIAAMREAGMLGRDADPGPLATAMMASLQGGLQLCQLRREVAPLETALDAAISHLRTYSRDSQS